MLPSLISHTHLAHTSPTGTLTPDYITVLCQAQLNQLYISDQPQASWQPASVAVCGYMSAVYTDRYGMCLFKPYHLDLKSHISFEFNPKQQ